MIKNLSVSVIENYLTCPLSVKLARVDRIPEYSTGTTLVGRVIHKIVESALKERGLTGKYPDAKTMDDHFEPAYQAEVKEQEEKPWFVGWQWEMPEVEAKRLYRNLIPVARKALENYEPMLLGQAPAVEQRIDLEFATDIGPAPLIGYVDLLDASGLLADWKSTLKASASARAKELWFQFACYSFWSWPIVGDEIQRCRKVFLVAGGDPHIETVDYLIGPGHREFFANTAAEVWKAIHYSIYPPTLNSWKCSSNYCSFFGPCRSHLEKEKPQPNGFKKNKATTEEGKAEVKAPAQDGDLW